jgi:PAS domain S-box-containing protein
MVTDTFPDYQLLCESLMDAFASVDMNGRIVSFNELFRAMLGYDREELMTLTYVEITPARWHDYEQAIIEFQVIPRGYSDVYEKEYRRKDGTLVPVELRTCLSRRDDGRAEGMWAVIRDISQHKQLQVMLNEKIEQLESALAKVKHLEGIIPICMYCKKMRTDKEIWQQMEQYITEHSEASLSHGICPECLERARKELSRKP